MIEDTMFDNDCYAVFMEEEHEKEKRVRDNISRQAAIDAVNELTYPSSLVDVKRKLVQLPSADRPRGKWVEDTYGWVYCSHCKKYLDDYQMVFFLKPFDYCPHCGSEMRGDDNDIR